MAGHQFGEHAPLTHAVAHRWPHEPQLFGSVCSSTHTPLHADWLAGQGPHAAFWKAWPGGHGVDGGDKRLMKSQKSGTTPQAWPSL